MGSKIDKIQEEIKMLTIYTTEEILTDIYHQELEKYDGWYRFIIKIRPRINVLMDQDSDFEDNEYNPVFRFLNDFNVKIEPEYCDDDEVSLIAKISSLSVSCVPCSCPIFILDVDKKTARAISDKYGIICHSLEDSPEECEIFMECVEKDVEQSEGNRGWHELVKDCTTPANSLVFVDRYLFSKDRDGLIPQDGINNVFEVLRLVLPKTLYVDYHVLFVFDASTLSTSVGETFQSITEKINNLIPRLKRPYKIIFELISIDHNNFNYDETHNRRILSNYFIIRVDRSLKAFRAKKALYTQSLFLDWAASKGVIRQFRSDTPAKALYKYLKEVRKAVNQLKKSVGDVPFTRNGIEEPISTIKNRLIQEQ